MATELTDRGSSHCRQTADIPAETRALMQTVASGSREPIPNAFTADLHVKLPWMPMYVADLFDSDTLAALSEVDQLRYIKLFGRSWTTSAPGFLQNSPRFLARMADVAVSELETTWTAINHKFEVTSDGRHVFNRRLLKEFCTQAIRHLSMKAGAGKRANGLRDERGMFIKQQTPSSENKKQDTDTDTDTESPRGHEGGTHRGMGATTYPSTPAPTGGGVKAANGTDGLPSWLPAEAWTCFCEMRRKMKSPVTERAAKLLIRELEKLQAEGHDVKAVLERSVMNGWKGVFAPKSAAAKHPGPAQPRAVVDYEAGLTPQPGGSYRF